MHQGIYRVLSSAVVTARTKEMLQSKKVQTYKGLGHDRAKRWKETWDSLSFDPLAIANNGNRRNIIKRAVNTKPAKGSVHILLDQ
jgi:hypothetical protein